MRQFLQSRSGLVTLGFLGVGGYLLTTEHKAHVLNLLPWIFVGACLVMHLFMHTGHGGHGGDDESAQDGARPPKGGGDGS